MIVNTVVALLSLNCIWQTAAAGLQFCNVEPKDEIDFCLGLNTYHDDTMKTDDYYMSMSIKFDRSKWGWVAVGAGSYIMHRSLMFVAYPGEEYGSIVLGARSTSYHEMPHYSSDLPNITVTDTGFEDGYHSVNFICHACNRWDGASLRADSDALPWIWANNPYADAGDDDPDKPLDRHMFYGNFFMDMRAGQKDDSAKPTFPEISAKRKSIASGLTSDIGGGGHGHSHGHSHSHSGYAFHGLLMALAFGLLYPGGVAALLSGWPTAVKYHMLIQGGTAGVALLGAAIGIWRAVSTGGLGHLIGPHTSLGVLVSSALIAQGVMGWRNHVHFVRTHEPAPLRDMHKYLGRGIWVASVGNALLGIAHVSGSPQLPAAWVLLIVVDVAGYWYLRRVKRARDMADALDDDEKEGYVYNRISLDERRERGSEDA